MNEQNKIAKKNEVKSFFRNTEQYLNGNAIISIRREILHHNLKGISGKNIIDVGCGDASVTAFLAKRNHMTFFDLSEEMLDIAKQKVISNFNQPLFIHGDIEFLETNRSYDIVISIGVLAHVNEVSSTLAQLSKIINSGGKLIIQFTEARNIITYIIKLKNRLLDKKSDYEINRTCYSEINEILGKNKLVLLKRVRYWPVFPGLGKLNYNFIVKVLHFLYSCFPFSIMGNENIVFFTKVSENEE